MKITEIELQKQDFKTIEELILKDFEKKLKILDDDMFSFSIDNQVSLHNLYGESIKLPNPFNLNLSLEFEFDGFIDCDLETIFFRKHPELNIMNEDEWEWLEWIDNESIFLENICDNIEARLKEILFS